MKLKKPFAYTKLSQGAYGAIGSEIALLTYDSGTRTWATTT